MRPYELWVAHMAWDGDSKRRPALVVSLHDGIISVYPITSKYDNKSERIKKKYFPIKDWKDANLRKASYVDTNNIHELSVDAIDEAYVGRLSDSDKARFIKFLSKRSD